MPDFPWGSARLRKVALPGEQYLLVLDRAGLFEGDEVRRQDAIAGTKIVLDRVGPQCAGVWRFAGELTLEGFEE